MLFEHGLPDLGVIRFVISRIKLDIRILHIPFLLFDSVGRISYIKLLKIRFSRII